MLNDLLPYLPYLIWIYICSECINEWEHIQILSEFLKTGRRVGQVGQGDNPPTGWGEAVSS